MKIRFLVSICISLILYFESKYQYYYSALDNCRLIVALVSLPCYGVKFHMLRNNLGIGIVRSATTNKFLYANELDFCSEDRFGDNKDLVRILENNLSSIY